MDSQAKLTVLGAAMNKKKTGLSIAGSLWNNEGGLKQKKPRNPGSKQIINPNMVPEFGFRHLEEKYASQDVKKGK